jgi:hypothetical protein
MLAYLFGWGDEGVEETDPRSRRQKYLCCKLIQTGGIKLKPNTPCITDIITIEVPAAPAVDKDRLAYEKKRFKRHKKLLRPIM